MSRGYKSILIIGDQGTSADKLASGIKSSAGALVDFFSFIGESFDDFSFSGLDVYTVRVDFKSIDLSRSLNEFLSNFSKVYLAPSEVTSLECEAVKSVLAESGFVLSSIKTTNGIEDSYEYKFDVVREEKEVEQPKSLLNIIDVMKHPVGTGLTIINKGGEELLGVMIGVGIHGKVFILPSGDELTIDSSIVESSFCVTKKNVSFSEVASSKLNCTVDHELLKGELVHRFYALDDLLHRLLKVLNSEELKLVFDEGHWFLEDSSNESK